MFLHVGVFSEIPSCPFRISRSRFSLSFNCSDIKLHVSLCFVFLFVQKTQMLGPWVLDNNRNEIYAAVLINRIRQ